MLNDVSRLKKEKEAEIYKIHRKTIEEPNMTEKINWDDEKKVKLLQLEKQAKNRGIGFMERLKVKFVQLEEQERNEMIGFMERLKRA